MYFDATNNIDYGGITKIYNLCCHDIKNLNRCYVNLNSKYKLWVPTLSYRDKDGNLITRNAYENYLSDDKNTITEICPITENYKIGPSPEKKEMIVFMNIYTSKSKKKCIFIGVFKRTEIKRNIDGRKVEIAKRVATKIDIEELYPDNQN